MLKFWHSKIYGQGYNNRVQAVELKTKLIQINIEPQPEQMPRQSLTTQLTQVEPCRDSFNDSMASMRNAAAVRIPSSGLGELKFSSKELAIVSIIVPKFSPSVLTMREPRRNSSGHF